MPREMVNILEAAGGQIVQDEDLITPRDTGVRKVRADESRSAGDENSQGRSGCCCSCVVQFTVEPDYIGGKPLFRVRHVDISPSTIDQTTTQRLVGQEARQAGGETRRVVGSGGDAALT